MPETSTRHLIQSVMDRAAEHLVPLQVSLEVTQRCNLSCKHCYMDVPVEQELSFTELKGILDQLAEAGTMYLLLTGGECLVRRDFFDIAFYAKERGFMVILLTNGTLITPSVARELKRLEPAAVGMSLHGATAGTHDGITRRRGSFVSTIRAIKLLKGLGVTVSLQTLLMDSNIHEAEAIKSLVQRLEVSHLLSYDFVPTRSGSLNPYQYEADLTELSRYLNYESQEAGPADAESEGKEVCKAGQGICSISAAGDVFPCLMMPMKVGNLRQATFAEIWKDNPSPELTYLRSITWEDLTSCKNCNLARYCRRCMGVAYSETGELTKPAPSACRNAALKAEFFKRKTCYEKSRG